MPVHLQISVDPHLQIKKTVPCKSLQHMVKKADTGGNIPFSCSVQIQFQNYFCFLCVSFNTRRSLHIRSCIYKFFGIEAAIHPVFPGTAKAVLPIKNPPCGYPPALS